MKRSKKKTIKQFVVVLSLALFGMTGFVLGTAASIRQSTYFDAGRQTQCFVLGIQQKTESAADDVLFLTGENEAETYTLEFWSDGTARTTTQIRYIHQLSEHTLLITDQNFDEIEKELRIMQDLSEGEQ